MHFNGSFSVFPAVFKTYEKRYCALARFGNYSPDDSLKCTPLGPIAISYDIILTPNLLRTEQNPCRHGPCKNNGTCQAGFTSQGFRCICPIGTFGKKCERGKNTSKACRGDIKKTKIILQLMEHDRNN